MQLAKAPVQFDATYIKVNSKENYILFKDIVPSPLVSHTWFWLQEPPPAPSPANKKSHDRVPIEAQQVKNPT